MKERASESGGVDNEYLITFQYLRVLNEGWLALPCLQTSCKIDTCS